MAENHPKPKPERQVVIGMIGTPQYAEWLREASFITGIPKTVIVRQALRLWAEATNMPEPPPK